MKLKIYCEELHVSMNDVIRELIRDWNPEFQMPDKTIRNESNYG